MAHNKALGAGICMILMMSFFTVFQSPQEDAVSAFNQSNLIRVTRYREVDGRIIYRRVVPVSDFNP